MMHSLLLRLPLAHNESLLSWFVRLARHNRYHSHRVLLALCAERLDLDITDMPDSALLMPDLALINVVGSLTGLARSRIYAATAHRFTQVLTQPSSTDNASEPADPEQDMSMHMPMSMPMLAPKTARQHLCLKSPARYCPCCLRQYGHHQTLWLPKPVLVCLEHQCWLLDACPKCRLPVSTLDVACNRCCACGARLSSARPQRLVTPPSVLRTQRLLQAWLSNECTAPNEDIQTTPTLLAQSPTILYALVDGLRASPLLQVTVSSTCSPAQARALEWAGAMNTLQDWPNRFIALLHRQRREPQPGYGLGDLYTTWLNQRWLHPDFDFVQQAFETFLIQAYRVDPRWIQRMPHFQRKPELQEQFDAIYPDEAGRLLNLTRKEIWRLIRAGRIRACPSDEMRRNSPQALRRADARFLLGGLPDVLTPDECARYLGCSEDWVLEMLRVGILRGLGKSALLRLVATLSELPSAHSGSLDLADAIHMMTTIGVNSKDIFKQVQAGTLSFRLGRSEQVLFMDRSCFLQSELQAWIDSIRNDHGWVTSHEVEKYLAVSSDTLLTWVNAGILTPSASFGCSVYFDRSTINQLHGQILRGASFMRWDHVKLNVFATWLSAGWLKPIFAQDTISADQQFFWRTDLERLSYHLYLTRSYLLKHCSTSRQVKDWINNARVNLITDPDANVDWFHLTAPQRMRPAYEM